MGIEREIESITIAFEEPYGFYGESGVKDWTTTCLDRSIKINY